MLRLLSACVLLFAGCSPTGPGNRPPAGEHPAGWIYATAWGSNLTTRVNASSGENETVPWADPPIDENTWLWEGNISPINGDVVEQGETGRLWDRTFHLGAATGVFRDLGAPEVTSEHGFRWAPDGRAVVFLRHLVQGDILDRLVLLDPVTGHTDTLLAPEEVGGSFADPFWIAPDTVGVTVYDRTPPIGPMVYLQIATVTQIVSAYEEVPWAPWHVPLISADGAWLAHWLVRDSTPPGGMNTEFTLLKLYDRRSGLERTLRAAPFGTMGGSTSIAFSPDSRFLATCVTDTDVAIVRLSTAQEVKRLFVPYCAKLNWSWGPEGPPT